MGAKYLMLIRVNQSSPCEYYVRAIGIYTLFQPEHQDDMMHL